MKQLNIKVVSGFISFAIFATIVFQATEKKLPSTMKNPSIKKSEKAMDHQLDKFHNDKRYSSDVKEHEVKPAEKQPSKGQGKGL